MHLVIQLLGTPQFQLDQVPLTASRRAVVALLAYLAVSDSEHPGQRFTRESLAALLWTEYDQAKALANLRHTLWEVAQFLGEGWVIAEHEMISLPPTADLTLDVAQFRSLLAQAAGRSEPALRIPFLTEATELYRDDFLSGFSLKEGPSFNEWAMSKAASLRHEFAATLQMLIEDYDALNQSQQAILYAERLIELDPLNEAAHRTLMQLYALTDQQTAAIQQYRSLERLLRKELNVDPQFETRELYKRIRRGELKPVSAQVRIPSLERTKQKHNLPTHLTSFVGREKELDELSRLISQNRLVTLLGAGGIGKTRLALRAGQSLLNQHPDGVWFVPLESITDEDVVAQTVASALAIAPSSEHALVETLTQELQNKNLLLILDNCEHLLDACAQLAEPLLKTCPAVHILATSREALRLEGEAFYHLAPLAIPEGYETQSIEELIQYEAVRLFLERTRLVVSGFELTKANAGTVVRICDRLDGIPLAIELAAAHLDIFTPEEILKQLQHSFDLLVSHTRSVLPRHRTMHTSINWGWNLLSELERAFLRQISVFIGGWTLPAAEAVGVLQSRELTSALVKKSFLVIHQQEGHETRYRFHEVLRAYAQERLIEAGEEKQMRDRHLEYFVKLTRQFEPALQGIEQNVWLERLFIERDNIRAALEWAARTNVQAGLYVSNRLRLFWENCKVREEARWLLQI
jgi:predicted ATPase/DNA-binding SARP family transcriptional activator